LFFSAQSSGQKNAEWKVVSKEGKVSILQKDSIKTKKQFKVEFHLEGNVDTIKRLITDPHSYKEWISNIDEITTIEKQNDSTIYYLIQLSIWPIFTRQGIIKNVLSGQSHSSEYNYTIELDTNYHYQLEYDEARYVKLRWDLKQGTKANTDVTFHYLGYTRDYPDWVFEIIDNILIYSLEEMIENLTDFVENQ
jgi:hypothetical protein